MSERISNKDLQVLVGRINDLALGADILRGAKWVDDIPAHLVGSSYEYPHFVLEHGSATYGRAWRLAATGGSEYRTGHYDPLHLGSGYIGNTRREAYHALRGILAGVDLGTRPEPAGL